MDNVRKRRGEIRGGGRREERGERREERRGEREHTFSHGEG